jgi:hypothetical protein
MSQYWAQMPLDAPLHIRNQNRLFILGIVYFRIGGNESWQGRINKIVELANEMTPLNLPRWTYSRVEYALRKLREEGWLRVERPARNRALVYYKSHPLQVLPFKAEPKPEVQIVNVTPEKPRPTYHRVGSLAELRDFDGF